MDRSSTVKFIGDWLEVADLIKFLVEEKQIDEEDIICVQFLGKKNGFLVTFSSSELARRFLKRTVIRIADYGVLVSPPDAERKYVYVHYLPHEVSDGELMEALREYGKAFFVQRQKMAGWPNICNGSRVVLMALEENIPSYIELLGYTVHIVYRGQDVTCRLCSSPGHFANRCELVMCYKCKRNGHTAKDCIEEGIPKDDEENDREENDGWKLVERRKTREKESNSNWLEKNEVAKKKMKLMERQQRERKEKEWKEQLERQQERKWKEKEKQVEQEEKEKQEEQERQKQLEQKQKEREEQAEQERKQKEKQEEQAEQERKQKEEQEEKERKQKMQERMQKEKEKQEVLKRKQKEEEERKQKEQERMQKGKEKQEVQEQKQKIEPIVIDDDGKEDQEKKREVQIKEEPRRTLKKEEIMEYHVWKKTYHGSFLEYCMYYNLCINCKREGHLAKDCPGFPEFCEHCITRGHKKENCPEKVKLR